jgi:sialidase-1
MLKTFLFSTLLSFSAQATTPFLEKTDVFEGGKGAALYRIPGIVVTGKGTVLAYAEARIHDSKDWGEIEVHLRRSMDGGKTWDKARHIAHLAERAEGNPRKKEGGEKEQTVNNPVAIVDTNGTIHFLYCLNYARCFYMSSSDDGLTFSSPKEITAAFEGFKPRCPWNVLATGPGHGIQMKNGRLVVPVWLAYGPKPGDHAPSMTGTLYSDDHGQTWKAGDIAVPNEGEFANPNETTLALLADGRVMLNSRSVSQASRRLITTSADGATGWSTPRFDSALWEPICMGSLTALPQKPGTLVFANPHTQKLDATGQPIPGGRGLRENLSIKLSANDGQTWEVNKTLESGKSAYSDLAVLPDSTVLCFYERDSRLTIARFNEAWIRQPAR